MSAYSEIANALSESLHLTQSPVAVCLTDRLPEGVALWSGHAPAGCRFWQEASDRVFATSPVHHEHCAIGQYTHHLDMTSAASTDLGDALKVFASLTYVREEDIASIPVLESKPQYVVYGPLAKIPIAPDVVLL